MAQGVAWCARELRVPCTVIAPSSAPDAKVMAIERLGGRVIKVSFDEWWRAFEERAVPGIEGTFIHSFDDPFVMAGNGTIGLEILEDLPDVDAVVIPWGGGGLTCGIASALRQLRPSCKIFTAEVATAAPFAASLAAGVPTVIEYQPSWVDGIGAKAVFPQMFDRARALIHGALVADLNSITSALRLLVTNNHIVAEGAGACPVACALTHIDIGKIVCVISGGNIDLKKLTYLLNV
jgi:threonine dehydratase